jgi:hypothetical protein
MAKTLTSIVPIIGAACIFFATLFLSGCSDLKFVTAPAGAMEDNDPRENIVLKGIKAEFTSGSVVKTSVLSDEGTLFDKKGLLVLGRPKILMRDANTTLVTETVATTAVFYLSADKKARRDKGDFVLQGDVRHMVPSKENPSTAAVMVETSALIWQAKNELFEAPSYYRMVLKAAGKPPFVAIGDAFVASKDLRHWNVRYGGLATYETQADFRKTNQEKKSALEAAVPTDSAVATQEPAPTAEAAPPSVTVSPSATNASPATSTATESRRILHRIPLPTR